MRSATSGPICFDASHAARRSAASSLVRRISAIALSSTRRPSIVPRKLLKVDSTRGLELDDGAAEVGGHLVGHERVVEQVELAAQQRIGARRRWRLARRRGSRRTGPASARSALRASSAAVRRSSASGDDSGVRLPPRLGELELERPEARLDVGDELGGGRAPCAGSLRSPDAHVVGGGEDGPGVTGERFVDHLALEGDRGLARAATASS